MTSQRTATGGVDGITVLGWLGILVFNSAAWAAIIAFLWWLL